MRSRNVIVMLKMCTAWWAIHNLTAFDWLWLNAVCSKMFNWRRHTFIARASAPHWDAWESRCEWVIVRESERASERLRAQEKYPSNLCVTCSKWNWNWCNVPLLLLLLLLLLLHTAHRDMCLLHGETQRDFKSMPIILFASIFRPCHCCVFCGSLCVRVKYGLHASSSLPRFLFAVKLSRNCIASVFLFSLSLCERSSEWVCASAHVSMVWNQWKNSQCASECESTTLALSNETRKKNQQYTANRPFSN